MPELTDEHADVRPAAPFAPPSAEDRRRLTCWKWRCQLEERRFTPAQIDVLIVLRLPVPAASAGV